MSNALNNVAKLVSIVTITEASFGYSAAAADHTASVQAAVDSFGAAGGEVIVPSKLRLIIGSNLTIKPNVTLRGPYAVTGSPQDNTSAPYGTMGGALLVSSTATITLKGGASIAGLLLHRGGMTFPAADSSAFAGTAVYIDGDDAGVFQCMFLGFGQAIAGSGRQRPRIYDNNIDCTAGILIDNCADIVYVTRNHCWPFATIAALGPATSLQRSGAAYKFTTLGDWNKLTDCFSYGYFRGFWINNCNSMTLLSCSADSTGAFAGQIGYVVDGTSTDTRLIACQAAAQETGYFISTAAGVHTRLIGSDSWACANHGVLISSGDVGILGGIQRDTANGVTINNAASAVTIDGVRFNAISGSPINAAVSNSKIRIESNDYGNLAAGVSVVNNANRPVTSLASADPINLPASGELFNITGVTAFGTINGGWAGRRITFKFAGALTVNDGGASLKLAGNFVTTADDTMTLMHDGTAWYELSRSVN